MGEFRRTDNDIYVQAFYPDISTGFGSSTENRLFTDGLGYCIVSLNAFITNKGALCTITHFPYSTIEENIRTVTEFKDNLMNNLVFNNASSIIFHRNLTPTINKERFIESYNNKIEKLVSVVNDLFPGIKTKKSFYNKDPLSKKFNWAAIDPVKRIWESSYECGIF